MEVYRYRLTARFSHFIQLAYLVFELSTVTQPYLLIINY